MRILKGKLKKVLGLKLKHGGHSPNDHFEMCVMEAVAYVAGEPWSDSPQCVCPVISAFMRSWNDGLDKTNDESRDVLKPLIPLIIGSRSTKAVEEKRSYLAVDWLIRTYCPTWLELAKLDSHATKLRESVPIVDMQTLALVRDDCSAAYSAAYSAARSAADSAARSAAYSAARSAADSAADSAAYSAAYSAARSAARSAADSAARSAAYSAARSAADSAAYSAAYSAADSAARSAADSALAPTVTTLQASAIDLVMRMLAITEEVQS